MNTPDLAFLTRWANATAAALARQLPADRFRVAATVRSQSETTERLGATGTTFDPPPPTLQVPARFGDRVAVDVTDLADGTVAAAVLFAGPDDKRDPGALALGTRAAALLLDGAGVVVVDAVPGAGPGWGTHLHSLTGVFPILHRRPGVEMTVVAIRPAVRGGDGTLDVWHHPLRPGAPLPAVPLAVKGFGCVRLDLDATHAEAARVGR